MTRRSSPDHQRHVPLTLSEVRVNWNKWMRQVHRWLSLAFTLAVIANLVALGMKEQRTWIGLLALFPLIPLLATGLYLFVLPYVTRRRVDTPELRRAS